MTVKFEDASHEFIRYVREVQVPKFLNAAGHACVNQAVQMSHVLTGLYRNTLMYRLGSGNGSGEFSKMRPVPTGELAEKHKAAEKERSDVSRPDGPATVRVGLNLIYAGRLERRFGIIARSLDLMRIDIQYLGEKVFKL